MMTTTTTTMAMIFHNSHVMHFRFTFIFISRIAWTLSDTHGKNLKFKIIQRPWKHFHSSITHLISLLISTHGNISFCIWYFFLPFSVIVIFTCMCKLFFWKIYWKKYVKHANVKMREAAWIFFIYIYMYVWGEMLLFFMCWTCFIAKKFLKHFPFKKVFFFMCECWTLCCPTSSYRAMPCAWTKVTKCITCLCI